MDRTDLYTPAHKGLRAALFDAVRRVAREDFAAEGGARDALTAVTRTLRLLTEYAALDRGVLLPEIAVRCPDLAAALGADRARIDGLERRCAQLAGQLGAAAGVARTAVARRLHASLALLAAEHIVHMDRLETQANRLLWAHLTDDDLRALRTRMTGMIPPARLAAWLEAVAPACSRTERAEILDAVRAALPAPTFESVTAPATAAVAREELEEAVTR